jgi:hypothetical protein
MRYTIVRNYYSRSELRARTRNGHDELVLFNKKTDRAIFRPKKNERLHVVLRADFLLRVKSLIKALQLCVCFIFFFFIYIGITNENVHLVRCVAANFKEVCTRIFEAKDIQVIIYVHRLWFKCVKIYQLITSKQNKIAYYPLLLQLCIILNILSTCF